MLLETRYCYHNSVRLSTGDPCLNGSVYWNTLCATR